MIGFRSWNAVKAKIALTKTLIIASNQMWGGQRSHLTPEGLSVRVKDATLPDILALHLLAVTEQVAPGAAKLAR